MIFHSLLRRCLQLPGAVAPLLVLPVLALGTLGTGREGSRCRQGIHPETAVTSVRARCPSYDQAVLNIHTRVGAEGWGGDVV